MLPRLAPNRISRQLFALAGPPPARLDIAGRPYALQRVFKHDFYAATCLYEAPAQAAADALRIVVKFGRSQRLLGLPLAWLGRRIADHEAAIYDALEGVAGIPRWLGRLGPNAYAIEYIEGHPLDHAPAPPPGFFDDLRRLFSAIHGCGVAYCDANKRSNILVGPGGQAYLVDFQISLRPRADLPWPLGALHGAAVRYLQGKDIYHLYKHKRRLSRAELTPEEERISRRRDPLLRTYRFFFRPYRAVRRGFLRRLHRSGRLTSPTAALEDHFQPEKKTWRN